KRRHQARFTASEGLTLLSRRPQRKGICEPLYMFNLQPRKLKDYNPRCHWQQTAPRSQFRKGRVCTRLTSNGRLTLIDTKFIVTRGGKKVERPVKDPEEFAALLRRHFGIDLNRSEEHTSELQSR